MKVKQVDHIDALIELIDLSDEEMTERGVFPEIQGRVRRLRDLYNWWLVNPRKSDNDVVMRAMNNYGICRTQAYNDLRAIKHILGNVQRVSKDFARYKFDIMIEQAFEKARSDNDAKGMAAAAAAYGKYHLLDKEDPADNGYDLIMPQVFIPTSDPRELGLKRIPNISNKIKKLLKKYSDSSMQLVRIEQDDYQQDQLLTPAEEVTDD